MNPASSQFSPAHYWAQGDGISHAVAYVLLLMSLLSWYVILSKAIQAWRMRRSADAVEAFWAAPGMPDAIAQLALLVLFAVFAGGGQERRRQGAGGAALAGIATTGHRSLSDGGRLFRLF